VSRQISWNHGVKLILSDVDETIAPLHAPAEAETIMRISSYLRDGGRVCFITGNSLQRVRAGITDQIAPELRVNILIGEMSGLEMWGFDASGALRDAPFVSHYARLLAGDIEAGLAGLAAQLVAEFGLRGHRPQPEESFRVEVGDDPRDIFFSDRRAEITLEFVNERGGDELRVAACQRAGELVVERGLPVIPRLAGSHGLDLMVHGLSKAIAVEDLLTRAEIIESVGLSLADIAAPGSLEVWGDDFNGVTGGIDLRMSEALPAEVRSICFREEDPSILPVDRNVVLWDGDHRLADGVLEFLRTRED
jgi:hypothetical protein